MKYLILFLLFLSQVHGFEKTVSTVITPGDLGLQKLVYVAKPGYLFVYAIRITKGGVVDSDVSYVQADADRNEIFFISGSPPWSKGPIFQLTGVGFSFDGYVVTTFSGNGSTVFDYKLEHRTQEKIEVSIRLRELTYAEAKAEFPEIPAEPKLHTENSGWWKRCEKTK